MPMSDDDRSPNGEAPPAHVAENRRHWDDTAGEWVAAGERGWRAAEPHWGIWQVPNSQLPVLPERNASAPPLSGDRVVDLGCGTGYCSRWMELLGADAVGLDNSAEQLATAARLAVDHGSAARFVHANAEHSPFPDGSFDLALSEYGAAIWCDPLVWVPEAHRVLRRGGRLVFMGDHPLAAVCTTEDGESVTDRLRTPWFGLHRMDWTDAPVDPGGVEFNLPTSRWLALFREVGFEVQDHREVLAPEGQPELRYTVPREWALRWPSEQVWWLRKS